MPQRMDNLDQRMSLSIASNCPAIEFKPSHACASTQNNKCLPLPPYYMEAHLLETGMLSIDSNEESSISGIAKMTTTRSSLLSS